MMDELDSIERAGTWSPATQPPGKTAIGLKWVFKVKPAEEKKNGKPEPARC